MRRKANSDILVCKQQNDGKFTVKSYYDLLLASNIRATSRFPYKRKVHVLPRIACAA